MSKTLFEQAIAEAKDVRKTALENAKLALEESMTTKLQNMFSSKLSEELNEEEDLEENQDEDLNESEESEELEENLNEESEDDDSEESESDDETESESDDESDSASEAEVDDSTEAEDSMDDQNVSDLSVEDLKTLIADTVRAELASEATPVEGDETMDDMSGDVSDDMTNTDLAGNSNMGATGEDEDSLEDDEDVNLEEVFAELEAINKGGENIKEAAKAKKSVIKKSMNKKTGAPGFKKVGTLNEAYKVINIQRKELKDLNLLNAKLIYVNSIFKSKSLNESQKLKVIEKFDTAETIKEAKLIFETLMETTPKMSKKDIKKPLKESMSFASKPAGVAPKKTIVQVDESVKRFQELAGIIKK